MKSIAIIPIISFLSAFYYISSYAQNDTITQLPEVKVNAEKQKFEDGKIIYFPSRADKNLSYDPASLIKRMHMPNVVERDGSLMTLQGTPIEIYINGVKAQYIDVSTFWPKNALRVEYMDNPIDPMYEGARAVVNIIMREYEFGGVSKINLFQAIPNNGSYEAASKLTKGRLTYSASFLGRYSYNDKMSSTATDTYSDIFLNNIHYDILSREFSDKSIEQANAINAHLNLKYTKPNFTTTHDISYWRNDTPKEESRSSDSWNPDVFIGDDAYSLANSLSHSISANGYYYWRPAKKFILLARWDYAYSHQVDNISSTMGILPTISNNTRENLHKLTVKATPSYYFNDNMLLQLKIQSSFDWSNIKYLSNNDSHESMFRNSTSAELFMTYSPLSTLYLRFAPGLSIVSTSGSGFDTRSILPTATAFANWTVSKKCTIGANIDYYMESPSLAELSDMTIQNSSLLWVKGNSSLRTTTCWDFMIFSNLRVLKFLRISPNIGYYIGNNEILSRYYPASSASGGLVKEYFNGPTNNRFRSYIGINADFFNGDLNISLTPAYSYYFYNSDPTIHLNCFHFEGSAEYTLKNFSFNLSYYSRSKDLVEGGMEWIRSSDSLNFEVSYGNGNIYASAKIENILNSRKRSNIEFISDYYRVTSERLNIGRRLMLSFVYTFGYGKKVDRDFDFQSSELGESIKLK